MEFRKRNKFLQTEFFILLLQKVINVFFVNANGQNLNNSMTMLLILIE